MKHRLGFTVVEIIVVVTAIAILASIGTVTYSGLQARARDEDRLADMSVMASYLETHREQKGSYPTVADFYLGEGYGVSTATPNPDLTFFKLNDISASALTDPSDVEATAPSYSYRSVDELMSFIGDPASWPESGTYTYLPYTSSGSEVCLITFDESGCSRFVLYYKDEAGDLQEVKSKYGN